MIKQSDLAPCDIAIQMLSVVSVTAGTDDVQENKIEIDFTDRRSFFPIDNSVDLGVNTMVLLNCLNLK